MSKLRFFFTEMDVASPCTADMVLIEAHFPLPLSHGVLFPMRWPVALSVQVLVPKQPKYG